MPIRDAAKSNGRGRQPGVRAQTLESASVAQRSRPEFADLALTSQVLSPLRYPGSKRRQARYIAHVLCANGDSPDNLVEPFAGGASVSLYLLKNKVVASAMIGEKDPLVAAFWRIVKDNPEALVAKLRETTPTVKEWKRMRASKPRSDTSKAFKCLFLNRTSFGGILASRTGPIGGVKQRGTYLVGCRYAAEATAKRILECHRLLQTATIIEGGYQETLRQARKKWQDNLVAYLDPPFFHKADRLYTHAFSVEDHQQLHDWLEKQTFPWILSYDSAGEIEEMYGDFPSATRKMHIRYTSASNGTRDPAHELVMTKLAHLPLATEFVAYRPKKKVKT